MTDYLVISSDPEEPGERPAVDAAALRRLLSGTAFGLDRMPERALGRAAGSAQEQQTGHCRFAAYYED